MTTAEIAAELVRKIYAHESSDDYLDYDLMEMQEDEKKRLEEAFLKHFHEFIEGSKKEDVQRVNIKDFIISKDKVAQAFFGGLLEHKSDTEIYVNSKDEKPIPIYVTVNYPTLNGVEISNKDLTRYDYAVYNTLVSLYEANNSEEKVFSIDTIYRNMTGNPGGKTTDTSYNDVIESIRKLSQTSITIEDRLGAEAWGYEAIIKREENMLMSTIDTLIISGYTKSVIRISKTPILYWYASRKNQIERVPSDILTTPINKSKDIIALQHYLLERIVAAKGKGKHIKSTIKYSTLYEKVKTDTKVNERRARDYTRKILDYWESKGFIKGYSEKRGPRNAVISIEIKV